MMDYGYEIIINNKGFNESVEEIDHSNFSDYELYQILEENEYKTTTKNLQLLKEGLESNKYIIKKYDKYVKKAKKTNEKAYNEILKLDSMADEYPVISDINDPRISTLEKFRLGYDKVLYKYVGRELTPKELENLKSHWGMIRDKNVKVVLLAKGNGKSIDGKNRRSNNYMNAIVRINDKNNYFINPDNLTKKGTELPKIEKVEKVHCHSLEDALKVKIGSQFYYKGKLWHKDKEDKLQFVSIIEPKDRQYVDLKAYRKLGSDDDCGALYTDGKRSFYLNYEYPDEDDYEKLIAYEKEKNTNTNK